MSNLLSHVGVPTANRFVVRAREESAAIAWQQHRFDPIFAALQRAENKCASLDNVDTADVVFSATFSVGRERRGLGIAVDPSCKFSRSNRNPCFDQLMRFDVPSFGTSSGIITAHAIFAPSKVMTRPPIAIHQSFVEQLWHALVLVGGAQ